MARGPDSLGVVELVMELEGRFGLDIPDHVAERMRADVTVGEIYRALLEGRTGVEPPPMTAAPPGDPTWERLVAMVERLTEIPREKVTFETRPFV